MPDASAPLRGSSATICARRPSTSWRITYYLARCCILGEKWERAEQELQRAIEIGSGRVPPLRLRRIRGLVAREIPPHDMTTPEEHERRALNRATNRLAATRPHGKRPPRRSLPARPENQA